MPLHFSLHLAPLLFFYGHVVAVFSMVPAQGYIVVRRSALSCGALSGLAALCLACVSVVVHVFSYVLVRVFHLGSWGGPLLFREPAELQSPMEALTPPAPLLHCHSAHGIEEQQNLLRH